MSAGPSAAGSRWWDRALNVLVPAALIVAMLAYAFPFLNPPSGGVGVFRVVTGLGVLYVGVVALVFAPQWFVAFSLPLILAFTGLVFLRRPGWIGSAAPLACSLVGFAALGSAYFLAAFFLDTRESWAYGYYAAEGSFLVAAIASAVRLIRLRRSRALWSATPEPQDEPAASASQQLLSRYRKG